MNTVHCIAHSCFTLKEVFYYSLMCGVCLIIGFVVGYGTGSDT